MPGKTAAAMFAQDSAAAAPVNPHAPPALARHSQMTKENLDSQTYTATFTKAKFGQSGANQLMDTLELAQKKSNAGYIVKFDKKLTAKIDRFCSKPANQQKFAQQIQYIQQRVRVIKDDNNINKSKLGLR